MKYSLLFLMLSLGVSSQDVQDSILLKENLEKGFSKSINYPEGIYTDLKSFQAKTPNLELGDFEFSQHEKSELHYCFEDNDRKDLRKNFAVSYKGDLYINIVGILRNKKYGSYTSSIRGKCFFFRSQPLGNKIEVFGNFMPNNNSMGMFGALGSLVGSAISLMSQNAVPVIYDEKIGGFAILHNTALLKRYLTKYYPNQPELIKEIENHQNKDGEEYLFIRSILEKLDANS